MSPPKAIVVGAGLMGGSVAAGLIRAGWTVEVRDRDPARVARARELGLFDADPAAPADLGVVAVPVDGIAEAARDLLDGGIPVVTDVGSVKGPIVRGVGAAGFVGGHPMAGSEQDGLAGARADMFVGAAWVLTPTDRTDAGALAAVHRMATDLGADVLVMDPTEHDRTVALVSHVPHLTAVTLMQLASREGTSQPGLLRMAAGGFRDMTRIAAGHPAIWPDICAANREAICAEIDHLVNALREVRAEVAAGDRAGLLERLNAAREARRHLPGTAGRAESLCEVRVTLADRPGELATVTRLATDLRVNIYDLEIAHSAQGVGGVAILVVDAEAGEGLRSGLAAEDYAATVEPLVSGTPGPTPPFVVAIDGPAGAGKSTVSRRVAEGLGLSHLDTGSMYRAVTAAVINRGIDPTDSSAVVAVARDCDLRFTEGEVWADGVDVTALIREAPVDRAVSAVASLPEVRSLLRERQRSWAIDRGGGVLEGRDIGTVVCPDATLKVFLTASPLVRATRRHGDRSGEDLDRIAAEIAERDHRDATRADSPMRPAEDADLLDSSDMGIDEVVDHIIAAALAARTRETR